jgi:acyl carrier protein
MAVCTICGEGIDPGGRVPDGSPECLECARLLRWFRAQLDDDAFRVPKEEYLTPERTFLDLGADSLDTVELVIELEEEFGVTITDLEAERVQTLADLLLYIRLHAKKGRGQSVGSRDPLWDRELDG